MSDVFLDADDMVVLTGRKTRAGQIAALRAMQPPIPFRVNALGWPVVTRAAVEGGRTPTHETQQSTTWQPRLSTV